MRILLLGPRHDGGSLPPYLAVLATALRRHGNHVDWRGTDGLPYDTTNERFWVASRILRAAQKLLRDVDLDAYDIISLHFGNLEIEQLIPTLLPTRRPPVVHHVHSLDWTLFSEHVPVPELRDAVHAATAGLDGYLCFGRYAQQIIEQRTGSTTPSITVWLPTTIPPTTTGKAPPGLGNLLTASPPRIVASLYGYAAPWKDAAGLVHALRHAQHPTRVVLAGPFWDDPQQAGTDLAAARPQRHPGAGADLVVCPDYLDAQARKALVRASDLGVFPYRHQPTFQGSGAIADYVAHGTPVLVTDVANMTELAGPAGLVVPPNDAAAFAAALDRLAGNRTLRDRLTRFAIERAPLFTADHHAAESLRLYEKVIHLHRGRTH
ncbi:MAG: glycosyltransferase [Micromonosporaceae bacterium]